MLKSVLKRQFSLALSMVMAFCMLIPVWAIAPAEVYAADLVINTDGLRATYDQGTWKASGTTLEGSATGSSGCSDSSTTSVLTLKNTKGASARLSFSYAKPVLAQGGHVKIDSTAVSAAGSFSKELQNNESVTVEILSGNAGAYTSSIKIEDIQLVKKTNVTTTFVPATSGGSFSVDGTTVTGEYSNTRLSTEAYSLKAVPASNYKFFGWKSSTAGIISNSPNYSAMFETNQTVTAVFLKSTDPVFQAGNEMFTDLNDAVDYSVNNSINKIALVSDGVLPAGDYTIPGGKTLLIPFDSSQTIYTDAPDVVYGSHSTPSPYRTLTMASGANLVVEKGGAISVPSKLSATGQFSGSWNGTPTGPHGKIHMTTGSAISLNSGASLYCYGYISGGGSIVAKSGSTVWECFQLRSWRGGTAINAMRGNKNKVFPMNQYYVQNIEAPLTIMSGATENVYTSVNMGGSAYPTSATFIGSDGLFKLSKGSICKHYDGSTDRLIIDVEGSVSLSNISISLSGVSVDSKDYVLPINGNITVNIDSGKVDLTQDIAFLPGAEVIVSKNAELSVNAGKNAYIYDADDWGPYAGASLKLIPVGYSTVNGTAQIRKDSSIVGTVLDVNGAVTVNGTLYTTSGGADIKSSEKSGRVVFAKATSGSGITYQATQNGTDVSYVEITVTDPQLHNGVADPEYTQTNGTEAGGVYSYCAIHGKWELGDPHEASYQLQSWKWTEDHSSAKAVLKCEQNDETIEVDAEVSSEETPAGCEEEGSIVYTASAKHGEETYTDTQTVSLAPLGHAYGEPEYEWNADDSKVTATRVCGHDQNHKEIETVDTTSEVTKTATCEAKGETTYTATFENAAFKTQTKTVENINALGHDWGEPVYEWSEDNKSVTATRTCGHDQNHKEIETVDTTSEVTKAATCEARGETTYTATFENAAFETQTKTIENIDALGHDWGEPVYEWSEDNKSITATRVCANDGDHKEIETVETTSEVIKAATCEAKGETTYTATFENAAFETQTKTIENINALGHEWGEPVYEWSEDNKSVTATRTCGHDQNHKEIETVDTTSEVTKAATCEAKGETTYTATFENAAFETQTKTIENINALGHDWGEPVYEWSEDNKSVTATIVCNRNDEHVITETADTAYSVKQEPTAEEEGIGLFSADFKDENFENQTREVSIPAIGHTYQLEGWEWEDDYSKATLVVKREDGVIVRVIASVVSDVKDATCTEQGTIQYTATVDFDNTTYSDTRTKTIDPSGHRYELSEWNWNDDLSEAKALFTCAACKEKIEKKADVNSNTTDATCEEEGRIDYIATIELNEKTYTDSREKKIGALGHNWGDPSYKWSEDSSKVTATRVCTNDSTHKEIETVDTISEVTKTATCEEKGETTYKATFENASFETQTKTVENIDALGHSFKTPEYTWSEDYGTAFAKQVCKNDPDHVVEETVRSTHKVISVPDCENKGLEKYTAAFTKGEFADQIKEVELPSLGHKWNDPSYEWSGDNKQVTAIRVCGRDGSHKEIETANVISEVTKPATCEAKGETTYKASFENEFFKDQLKSVEMPAAGHKWDEGVVTKKATLTKDGLLTYTCLNCGKKKQKVLAKINDAKGDGDSSDSVFRELKLRSRKQTKKSISLSWNNVKGASSYVLYGNKCGVKNKLVKLTTFRSGQKSYVLKNVKGRKVKKGTYYKMMLVAYDSSGRRISTSKVIHVVTKGGKYTNFKRIKTKAKKNKVVLRKGKKFKLKARGIKVRKTLKTRIHRKIKYEVTNKKVATVSKKGVIKARSKGVCYVYAYAQNGVSKRIKVTVR